MVGADTLFAQVGGFGGEMLEIVIGFAIEVIFSLLLFATVVGFFFLLSRLDGGFDSLDSSVEPNEGTSKRRRLAGWVTWALPTTVIAVVVGYLIWDTTGILVGAVYGLANAGGTARAIRLVPLGKRARRTLIGTCLAQVPIGILTFLAEGL